MYKKSKLVIVLVTIFLTIASGCISIKFETHVNSENNVEVRFETPIGPEKTATETITSTRTVLSTTTAIHQVTQQGALQSTSTLIPSPTPMYVSHPEYNFDFEDQNSVWKVTSSANYFIGGLSQDWASHGKWSYKLYHHKFDPSCSIYAQPGDFVQITQPVDLSNVNAIVLDLKCIGCSTWGESRRDLYIEVRIDRKPIGSVYDIPDELLNHIFPINNMTGSHLLSILFGTKKLSCYMIDAGAYVDNIRFISGSLETQMPIEVRSHCDESKLAFVTTKDGNEEVYTMQSDGTSLINLTQNRSNDGHPTWSPNGDKLAFHSSRSGDYEIYTMKADGSDVTRLTKSPGWDGQPSWSPDGTRIAFESMRTGIFEIFVMKADGTEVRNLTLGLTGGYPAWSPDSNKIAIQLSGQEGNREIYVMDYDGSNKKRLTNTGSDNWMPIWSPDGKRIIFSSNRDGNWELYSVNTDGTDLTRLTKNASDDWWPVSFSPDGKRMVFTSNRFGNWDIFLMNVDGTNATRLTDDPGEDKWPVWRPCI